MNPRLRFVALLALAALLTGCDLLFGSGPDRVALQLRFDGDLGRLQVEGESYRSEARLQFDRGSEVRIVPLPDTGSGFASWSGACADAPLESCTLTLDADATVGADFVAERPIDLALVLTGAGSGTVTIDGTAYDRNATVVVAAEIPVTLAAEPGADSVFAGWGGACASARGTDCTVALDAPATVEANFVPASGSVSVLFGGDGEGAVLAENGAGLCTADCTLAVGSSVTLRAAPALGSTFEGWQDCDADGDRCTLDPLGEATAVFAPASATALGPRDGDCDGVARGDACTVPVAVHAPLGEPVRGAEFVVESGGFVLTGAELASATTGCLIAAGPQRAVLACDVAVALGDGAEVATVTLERSGALPDLIEIRDAFVVYDGDDAKSAVLGGALAVTP